MIRKITYSMIISLLTLSAYAGNQEIKDSVLLDEHIVTGSKFETSRKQIPFVVSKITAQEIRNSGQFNILSTLSAYVPGVFVTERNILGFGVSTGGSGAINIRGTGGSPNTQILMLIDGHPQFQGIFGHPLADTYVSSDIERVEIIRGPASVLYGSNAMGGVINLITRKQTEEGFSGQLSETYGSYNTEKHAGSIGYKTGKLSILASGNHGRTDGIRDNTDFRIYNGYAKAGYDISQDWNICGDFSIAGYNGNDNGPVTAPSPFNIAILRGKAALSLENNYQKLKGAVRLYHNFGDHTLSDGFISSDMNSGLMVYQSYPVFKNTQLTGGFDAKIYGGTANRGASANIRKTITETAGYVLIRQKVLSTIDLNGGLRLEHNSAFGTELAPMAGFAWQAADRTNFKGSASKGFRSPTVMELYTYAPNPDLKPEEMVNYEISWLQSFFGHRLNTELTAFWSDGKNMIQVVNTGQAQRRENVGAFRNQGVELSAKYAVNRQLSINANYSYLNTDRVILAAPRQQISLNANYSYKVFNLNLSALHIQGLHTSLLNSATESYTLLNARLSAAPVKRMELFISGQNLLDQQYQINEGYPMPGINFHGGINIKL